MSFFLSFISMMTIFQVSVEWVFDFIEIPVYEALEDYRYLPEAKIYIDGFLVVGAEVSYTRNGVERTFISTVNTSIVRNYTIYYRATFPDYNITSTQPIIFSVVDKIPPTIHDIPEKTMMVGGFFPAFEEGITYSDNYDDSTDLMLSFQISHITKHIVGVYHYGVIVIDRSGNQTKKVGVLHVVDLIPPTIIQKKEITIDVFSSWTYMDYFTISDNADTFLDVLIDDSNVDYQKIGDYVIYLSAMDDSQNITSVSAKIHVVDRVPPSLVFVPSPVIIDVFSEVNETHLKQYILDIQDNYDRLTLDDVSVIGVVNTMMIGTYKVTYEVKDSSANSFRQSLDIHVVDRIPPNIVLSEALIVDVFSVEPFWIQYFEFSDDYSTIHELTYQLQTKPNMEKIGRYPLSLTVTDKSGNKAIYQGFVEVVDRIPPIIIQLNEIIITEFEKRLYIHYFSVTDQYDQGDEISIQIDDTDVDYFTIGEYPIHVFATDRSGNQSIFVAYIWVVDIIEPTLSLTNDYYKVNLGEALIDLSLFIDEAYDNYDQLGKENVLIIGEIDTSIIGKTEIIYELVDRSENKQRASLWITVDDDEAPTLTMGDLFVVEGMSIDPYEGIQANDNHPSFHVLCLNDEIDDYLPGHYVLTYVVMDARGNYQTYQRNLFIEPIKNQSSITDFMPVILITCLGIIAAVINYRYYK